MGSGDVAPMPSVNNGPAPMMPQAPMPAMPQQPQPQQPIQSVQPMNRVRVINKKEDLYEKGYLTYPRTNSEYLATAEKDKMKTIIKNIKELGYHVEFKDKKNIIKLEPYESKTLVR